MRTWSYKAGEKGKNRVRVFEYKPGSVLYLEYFRKDMAGRRTRHTRWLGHCNRDLAKLEAQKTAWEIAKAFPVVRSDPTVKELIELYLREVTPHKGKSKQAHDRRAAKMFVRLFGHMKASRLSRREFDEFIAKRRDGTIRPDGRNQHRS